MKYYQKWRQYQWYAIIGILSLLFVVFLPMLGTETGLAWNLPTTTVGWVVFGISKSLTAILNVLIFHCFICQAKVNIQDDEKYLKALEILGECTGDEDLQPRSPHKYFFGVYGKKGTTIFITSLISAVGLTQAILTFDWVQMLSYLFTVVMGVIFGLIQMNATEEYWTGEYYRYALKVKKDMELAKKELAKQEHDLTNSIRRADVLESVDSNGLPGIDG